MPMTAEQIAEDKARARAFVKERFDRESPLSFESRMAGESCLILAEIAWQLAEANKKLDAMNINLEALLNSAPTKKR